MEQKKQYTGPYKVVKVFKVSAKRQVLARNLSEEDAQRLVRALPSSSRHIVCYFKQFWADKYFE